jgi:hypothetical protein
LTLLLNQLEQELVTAPRSVMVVAGIGVSLASCEPHECTSWKGLLRHGLRRCQEVCGTDPGLIASHQAILDNEKAPPHSWISVGQFITDELNGRRPGLYGAWLKDSIGSIRATDTSLVSALAELGANLGTTNYDATIETGTGRSPITWRDRASATAFFRGSSQDVLHLHGYYRQPDTVILGARSYAEICHDEFFQTALRGLMIHGTLIFVGCGAGLEDQNFGTLLEWGRRTLAECQHTHFILVRAAEVDEWRQCLKGMPIEPVSYGAHHGDLLPFITGLVERVRQKRVFNPLSVLSSSQTDFEARWDELGRQRQELPPSEYFSRSRTLAQQLWVAGGRHRAALAFSNRLVFQAEGLLNPEYVDFALDAAERLLDDDMPSLASQHLGEIAKRLADGGVPEAHRKRFLELRIRCMDSLCAYTETLRAIEDTLPHVTGDERRRLEAERSEIHFLQGNFGQAVADSEGA